MKFTPIYFYLLLTLAGLGFSCQEENVASAYQGDGLTISSRVIAGWCNGDDSLFVSPDSVVYWSSDSTLCNIVEDTAQVFSAQEWKTLRALLDVERFRAIELNTCGVCADGNDTILEIRGRDFRHQIRYSDGNAAILQPIRPFIDKLNAIRTDTKQ